ncbi:MAG: hypothetical protein IJE78_12055 [Bacteroidaceae bacterium]|nr:hypothetical protein [Bacteroidaceae bacterium]
MLNRSGITNTSLAATKQILANVDLQSSVGCIVPQTLGVVVGSKKIAKAGTPIKIDLMNLQTAAVKADGTTALNAVLLHDVDVTAGNANGTALIFGFVNVNRVDSDVATAITTAVAADGVSQMITFMKA